MWHWTLTVDLETCRHSFLSYAADKQTNRQKNRLTRKSYPRRPTESAWVVKEYNSQRNTKVTSRRASCVGWNDVTVRAVRIWCMHHHSAWTDDVWREQLTHSDERCRSRSADGLVTTTRCSSRVDESLRWLTNDTTWGVVACDVVVVVVGPYNPCHPPSFAVTQSPSPPVMFSLTITNNNNNNV